MTDQYEIYKAGYVCSRWIIHRKRGLMEKKKILGIGVTREKKQAMNNLM